MTAPHTQCQPDTGDTLNALLLIEHGCAEGLATRAANDYGDKCREITALKSRVEELTKALETVKGMFGPSKCFRGCKCWRCQMNFTIDGALAPSLEDRK